MPGVRRRQHLPLDPIPSDPLSESHQPQLRPSPFRQRLPWWGADLQTMRDTIRSQRLPEDRSSALTIDLGGADALLAFMVSAVWAAAMAAGMGNLEAALAIGACQQHGIAAGLAAAGHRLQRRPVAGQQLCSVESLQIPLVALHQLGEKDHGVSSQQSWKPSSNCSMRSLPLLRTSWVMWA